jgi:hypothetical protein
VPPSTTTSLMLSASILTSTSNKAVRLKILGLEPTTTMSSALRPTPTWPSYWLRSLITILGESWKTSGNIRFI